jgi:hypothetical protein
VVIKIRRFLIRLCGLYKMTSPELFSMSVNKTDHWGHEYQYDTYLNLIHEADGFIKYIQQDDFYKDKTTLFITTDHGRGTGDQWHTHSADKVAYGEEIWFAVAGPDTNATGEQKVEGQYFQNQFAKTMAAFLGFDFNTGRAVGEVISSVMDKDNE